ncbi:hypothetical protein F7725_019818 [Dissostichus mawsoni]|uniref:Secreted protein n=1 Tax=Dissostichus mawsoni TaxID=36200 RepID=A0A7J5YMV5_DISMA|nr:hypothetical protein F7725_019818 [Dissostichus mawsoni]
MHFQTFTSLSLSFCLTTSACVPFYLLDGHPKEKKKLMKYFFTRSARIRQCCCWTRKALSLRRLLDVLVSIKVQYEGESRHVPRVTRLRQPDVIQLQHVSKNFPVSGVLTCKVCSEISPRGWKLRQGSAHSEGVLSASQPHKESYLCRKLLRLREGALQRTNPAEHWRAGETEPRANDRTPRGMMVCLLNAADRSTVTHHAFSSELSEDLARVQKKSRVSLPSGSQNASFHLS